MPGPWERYGGTGAPPAAVPTVIEGPPRSAPMPPGQTPTQAALDQERLLAARRENEQAAQPENEGTIAQRATLEARRANMDSLVGQINRVQELYDQGLRGQGLGSILEYLPDALSDTNAQFNSAAAGMAEQGLAAFRVPGVGSQSDAELRQFVQANRPSASDRDSAIEEKLHQLRARVEAARRAAGLPPPQWRQPAGRLDPETGGLVVDVSGGQHTPPPPPAPPAPPLLDQFGDAFQNVGAGILQGFSSIPDAATNALGATLALPADWLGFDWVANNLRTPITIGGTVEQIAPTPQDPTGRAVRFGSQIAGGVASTPQRVLNRVAEDVVGAVPRPTNALYGQPPSRASVARDAREANIPMLPADAGGPATRLLTAGIAQTPGGAGPIVNAAQRSVAAGQRELGRIAGSSATFGEEAGEAATRGALRYRVSSRNSANQLYDRAAQLAADVRVNPENAVQVLTRHIDELGQNPAGDDALRYLTGLRDTLSARFPQGVTVQGIRGMRTQLRDRFMQEGLRGSDVERRVMQVIDAASDDVATALGNAGRSEAASLYRTADAAWRARADMLDNVIMPIIGRQGEKSGTQVFQALQNAARSNGGRLGHFLRTLPEDEAMTVRSSIINALGRSSAGRQGAEGVNFSLNEFLTHWNQLAPSARNALFDRPQRVAIERLARVAEQSKAASGYANSSRTGGVVATLATGASLVGGWQATAATLAGQYIAGRLLASPQVANILAAVGGARTPQAARSAIGRLGTIAARNPALANDVGELQRRLLESLSASPATRAAAEQNQDVR